MDNTLAVLTQQTMSENYEGGRTKESQDNSQLILGLYRLENPTGVITIPTRPNSPKNVELLQRQINQGIIVATKSLYDKRPIDVIATEIAKTYDGSGGSSLATGDQYRSVEFATKSKEEMLATYFK